MELLDGIAAGWPAEVEGALRLVCTRGPEAGGPPTVYATLAAVPAPPRAARRDGITVATLPLGVPADGLAPGCAWLPAGIKSISYAVNSAARRWAAAPARTTCCGSPPTATRWRARRPTWCGSTGDTLLHGAGRATGILAGTTAGWLLDHAAELGLRAAERMVTPAELPPPTASG